MRHLAKFNSLILVLFLFTTILKSQNASDQDIKSLSLQLDHLNSKINSIEKFLSSKHPSYSYKENSIPNSISKVNYNKNNIKKYTIQKGDTLNKISRKHNIKNEEIIALNKIKKEDVIYPGNVLLIPTKQAPTKQLVVKKVNTKTKFVHTVSNNDTLTSISKKYNTSVNSIKDQNNLKSSHIQVGQKLNIDTKYAPKKVTQNNTKPKFNDNSTYAYYTIRENDTLYHISQIFFTNIDEITKLNGIKKDSKLTVGEKLIVPSAKFYTYTKNN